MAGRYVTKTGHDEGRGPPFAHLPSLSPSLTPPTPALRQSHDNAEVPHPHHTTTPDEDKGTNAAAAAHDDVVRPNTAVRHRAMTRGHKCHSRAAHNDVGSPRSTFDTGR